MDDTASNAFLVAVSQLPREKYPATHGVNMAFNKIDSSIRKRLPPHLHPLLLKLRVFTLRQTLLLEERLHMNPTFKLVLLTRLPPSLAFIAAAASTIYALRYLYTHALDLLTNIIGVAYPAYQSIMAIEYGDMGCTSDALGIGEPNLDKKQWLMYWAIYGVLTTADHWAGPILRLFPMYRVAKIGILIWAQHRKYNGAAWLYDTFVRPLLPPPSPPPSPPQQSPPPATALRRHTDMASDYMKVAQHYRQASVDSTGDAQEMGDQQTRSIQQSSFAFSAMAVPSVWDATTNIDPNILPPTLTNDTRA
ncbi:hypothetical protein IW146_006151 [Coemansia sp. RSA 922]|nr:hypothetical protein GGI08_006516 [Coemansia sp. S2]KAJ2109871.1 hypothetical protein IW146_006151 [Coemansia sp. RSA 922]KAJ2340511.1 hypothetical protein GGH92_006229 [Coemansia sp. RSA 2673]